MTSKELCRFLKDHLVPRKLYKVNGAHSGRICVEHTASGWEVFYSEKKDKVGLLKYTTESAACLGMMNELRKVMEQIYGVSWITA